MTAPTLDGAVVQPGVYPDMPAEVYHRDPVPGGSLSSSGARKLLPPSCPALFRHEQLHGRPPTAALELGQAAHLLVLGIGPEIEEVHHTDWRTKAAREARAEARAAGRIPMLSDDYETVQAMAEALREHPAAAALFGGANGRPEQSLFWVDGPTGVWRRARLDWYPVQTGHRLIVPDYKTARSAAPEDIQKAVHQFGYHQQAAWYLDGIKALGLGGNAEPVFVLVFQEKTEPFLVTVVELTPITLEIGRRLNRQAIDTYRKCVATGRWPGYADDVIQVSLPPWAESRAMEELFQ